MARYTIHHSRTGETRAFDNPVDVLEAWRNADANTRPCLIVTNDDGGGRVAACTTVITDARGNAVHGKSPQVPDLG